MEDKYFQSRKNNTFSYDENVKIPGGKYFSIKKFYFRHHIVKYPS